MRNMFLLDKKSGVNKSIIKTILTSKNYQNHKLLFSQTNPTKWILFSQHYKKRSKQ